MTYADRMEKRMVGLFNSVMDKLDVELRAMLGSERFALVERQAPAEIRALAATLPEIGRGNPLLPNLYNAAVLVAIGRVLMASGESEEDAGRAILDVARLYYESLPWIAGAFMRSAFFTPLFLSRYERWERRPEAVRSKGDWRMRLSRGQSDCDVRMDFTECGILKWLESIGSRSLCPYMCATDHISAKAFGLGFRREGTLAAGAAMCDCRYSKR